MIEARIPRRPPLLGLTLLGAQAIALRLRLGSLLRRRSLPDLLGSLTPDRPAGDPVPLSLAVKALRAAEALIERLRVVPDTCLYRALGRYAILRRAGHPARFVLGLKPPASEEISGHAWVGLGGVPAFEALDPGLVVTFAYPGPR